MLAAEQGSLPEAAALLSHASPQMVWCSALSMTNGLTPLLASGKSCEPGCPNQPIRQPDEHLVRAVRPPQEGSAGKAGAEMCIVVGALLSGALCAGLQELRKSMAADAPRSLAPARCSIGGTASTVAWRAR